MADLSKIKLNGVVYNLKDSVAREQFANKNFLEIIELGNFSMEDYDWEIDNYINDLTDTGFYHAFETEDGFDYWIEVKNIGSVIQQSYFYGEEPDREYIRIGFNTTDPIEWHDWTVKMTYDYTDMVFARKIHVHYETVTINQDIRTYLNNSTVFNDLANNAREKILYVINNYDNKTYYVLYSYMGSFTPRQIGQLYFSFSDPTHIYKRTGTRANNTNTWSAWADFTSGGSITNLGDFDLSDWEDFLEYLGTITNSGTYIAHEVGDGFYYFITVERTGDRVSTSWWSSEEGGYARTFIDGYVDGDIVIWDDEAGISYLTVTQANQLYASKSHEHYRETTSEDTIENYIDSLPNKGDYHVIINGKEYHITYTMRFLNNNWHYFQEYYEATSPSTFYRRTGVKNGQTKIWEDWQVFATNPEVTTYFETGTTLASIGDSDIIAPNATTSQAGLMSAQDKEFLDSLNPNMAATLTNINSSEFQIINTKASNALSMEIAVEPIIQDRIRTDNLLDADTFTSGFYIGSNGQLASNTNDRVGDFIPVSPGDDIYYTGIIGPTNSGSINRRLHVYKADKTWIKQISFAGGLKVGDSWSTHGTVPSNGAYVRVSWGVEDTNVMISVDAPTKYYPYYITPFTTITSASFAVGTTSDRSKATEYTITVPAAAGDQYGFSYNPIEGKLYSSTGHIDAYNGETLPGMWWSDRDTYAEGSTPTTGAEVIYKLTDEEDIEEYDITPITIPLGQYVNYFFIDGGYLKTLSYYAQTLRVQHITIDNGISFGDTNILESNIIGWNNAANELALKANIDSPEFTGSPLSTNPGVAVNNNRIATTAFVQTKMNNIAPLEPTAKASKNYSVDDYLFFNGQMYKVTAAIASGANLTIGTNIVATSVAEELKLLFAQL